MSEKTRCENCMWYDVCMDHGELGCDFFESSDDAEQISELEYISDLEARHHLYSKQIEEQDA